MSIKYSKHKKEIVMSKLYGYKEEDVKNLYEYVKSHDKMPLAKAFFIYGNIYGKSKGTVRNLYYAMAKKSREDEAFSKEFCGGEKLPVKSNVKFNAEEQASLMQKISELTEKGYSVRHAVAILSGGDATLALRYQNKYRNVKAKTKPKNMSKQEELKRKLFGNINSDPSYINKLKEEINGLYGRLLKELKAENEYLKSKLFEKENAEKTSVKNGKLIREDGLEN